MPQNKDNKPDEIRLAGRTTRAFLGNALPASDWVDKMKIYFYDGKSEMGRLPLEVWEDNFIATYKVPNYEVQKGVTCP